MNVSTFCSSPLVTIHWPWPHVSTPASVPSTDANPPSADAIEPMIMSVALAPECACTFSAPWTLALLAPVCLAAFVLLTVSSSADCGCRRTVMRTPSTSRVWKAALTSAAAGS